MFELPRGAENNTIGTGAPYVAIYQKSESIRLFTEAVKHCLRSAAILAQILIILKVSFCKRSYFLPPSLSGPRATNHATFEYSTYFICMKIHRKQNYKIK